MPAVIVTDVDEADALVTLRTYYRNREQTVMDAEHRGMPIYVLRANTVAQPAIAARTTTQARAHGPIANAAG